MRKIIMTAAILGLSSTMAFAQADMAFADIDTDASGEASLVEVQVAWPEFTQAEFDAADTDTSGGLSADELAAVGTSVTTDPVAPDASVGADTPTTNEGDDVGNPSDSDPAAGNEDGDDGDDEGSPSGEGS